MASGTPLNLLFRNLCHHSMWKYGIFWKFQDENHMLLTCVDSYAIDTKSGISMEYAQYKEFIDNHPSIASFGVEAISQNGSISDCSIIVAVSYMTQFSYLLGKGIVGKVASMERHQWIRVGERNSELLLECQEELGLQVAAGIKTILFLPVLPLGLVQLGSLDKLSEDLTMVAQLKDLFCAYQCTLDSSSTYEMRMGQVNSYIALNRPPIETYSTCLEINSNLADLKQSRPFTRLDLGTFSFDKAMVNEHLSMSFAHLPHPMVESYDPFSQVGFSQAHPLCTEQLDEIRWNAMCSELFQDRSEEQIMLNTSIFTERTMESDQSSTLQEEVKPIPIISHGLTSINLSMFDASMKDLLQHCDDFSDFNKPNLKFTEEFDGKNLDFFVEKNCFLGWNDSIWMDNQSKAYEGGELFPSFKAEVPETIECLVEEEESCFINKNTAEYLAQIAMEKVTSVSDDKVLESLECAKSCCNSSGRCSDSCLTQCRTEDASNSEDSGLESHKMSLITDSEAFASHLKTCPQRSYENSACGFRRSCLKKSHGSNRQVKNGVTHRSRPRDRQLIQDRIKELRDLIPNASKCSIDALLDQTVKHMMFLQSVPVHADKMSQFTRSKVGDKDSNFKGVQAAENPASLACETGTKSIPFPLVVENLDQPDQMLVEMQCRNHGLFFDIAQAFKRLGLTILKGILESRFEELWAHFIVEIPKGFHRMDIVWPLMQLLQLKF